MNEADMVALWDQHTYYEFVVKDAALALSTMVDDPQVMHLPTMSGGVGKEQVRRYYADVFIPAVPDGTVQEPICRSVGATCIVDEAILVIPHDREVPFLVPGVEPTGKTLRGALRCHRAFPRRAHGKRTALLGPSGRACPFGLVTAGELPMAPPSDVVAYLRKQAVPA